MDNDKNVTSAKIHVGSMGGPADGASLDAVGTFTRFVQPNGNRFKQQVCKCKIMASVSHGTCSISMKDSKGIMITVRLDELYAVIAKAVAMSKALTENMKRGEDDK